MKVFVLSMLFALAGYAAGGSISWPGAVAVKTIIPGETKTTAYSTSQYINALPASYSFGTHPQFGYQVPHINSFAPLPTGYYSIANPSYIPATNFIYPAQPSYISAFGPFITGGHIIPALPSAPSPPSTIPSNPGSPSESQSEPAGDSDSAVIDSADFITRQQNQPANEPSSSAPSQSQQNSYFFSSPQRSELASFASIPQISQNFQMSNSPSPVYPQSPQISQAPQAPAQAPFYPPYPQLPQQPNLPQNLFPQGPSPSPPTSFPGAVNNDSALNDEDTISVDSA